MSRTSSFQLLILFICSIFYLENVQSETVQHYDCWKPRGGKVCTIHTVDIDPCPSFKARKGVPNSCEYDRENFKTANLKITFTPEFNTSAPVALAYKSELLQDLPQADMDSNACKFTKCPLVAGVRTEYSYPYEMKAEYPEGSHTVKWKLYNPEAPIKEACCFKFKIVLI